MFIIPCHRTIHEQSSEQTDIPRVSLREIKAKICVAASVCAAGGTLIALAKLGVLGAAGAVCWPVGLVVASVGFIWLVSLALRFREAKESLKLDTYPCYGPTEDEEEIARQVDKEFPTGNYSVFKSWFYGSSVAPVIFPGEEDPVEPVTSPP